MRAEEFKPENFRPTFPPYVSPRDVAEMKVVFLGIGVGCGGGDGWVADLCMELAGGNGAVTA